jgi:hypothetical protein
MFVPNIAVVLNVTCVIQLSPPSLILNSWMADASEDIYEE